MMTTPVAPYLRFRTEEQLERQSIATQCEFADGWRAIHHLTVCELRADDGFSGILPDRLQIRRHHLHLGHTDVRRQSGDREHRLRHVLGSQRFRERLRGRLNWTAVQDLGVDQARADYAGPNAVLLFLDANGVSQPEQTALRSLVGSARNIGQEAGHRGNIYEMAGASLAQ